HIRNALQALAFYRIKSSDEKEMNIIDQAVSRITWALKEVLPKYPPEPVDDVAAASQKKLAAEPAIPSLGAVPLTERNQRATAAGMPARISSTAAKAASISSSWL